ncbi:MAG: cryptochrome/photolyase family protein [Ignavibacterium sp.]|uniref:cryptochrome/photolyase family protein n=1 Tax=Ignavibacterium sp. TaxID=2651167 RepID=UPI00404A89AB
MEQNLNALKTLSISLIFPHQLFEKHPALGSDRIVYLVEENLFFTQYKFHKQKLVFHRASMKFYQEFLERKEIKVIYIDSSSELSDIRKLILYLKQKGIQEIHFADVADNWLDKRIKQTAEKYGIKLHEYPSPSFLNSKDDLKEYFSEKKKYSQTDFYIKQRKKFGILLNDDGSPLGGKWTYDTENRLKYPTTKKPPEVKFPSSNKYYEEAVNYVNKNFPDNYGQINENFIYPNTFEESKKWFNEFLEKRFSEFGSYEDAIVANENILHHSVLTPMLNIGLLTPKYIVEEALKYSQKHKIPLNSVEGFIRQIIGWREFIRGVYEFSGTTQRTKNFWKFKRKIPKSFWNGTTGIEPLDITIKKVLQTGYCHHIERLMVLGNFMVLCEFDPDEVYRWFMELFIDAYDWVMVPNVYGMSQFADGGLMATKPYISSSNYLMKMSNYKKGDWQLIWDALFWRFMDKHRKFFLSNPRLTMLIKTFDKMDPKKKQNLLSSAENFLKKL